MEFIKNKKVILVVSLVLGLIIAGITFFWLKDETVSNEFIGQIKSVEGNVIVAEGVFVSTDPGSVNERMEVRINLTENTTITKVYVILPSDEELEKSGGYFDGTKLKREDRPSSLEAMIKDGENRQFSIFVKSSKNIYRKGSFTAEEIRYELAFLPEFFGDN